MLSKFRIFTYNSVTNNNCLTTLMPTSSSIKSSFTYRFLKFISKQPLSFSRGCAKFLALIANHVNTIKTTKAAELNLKIALPHLDLVQQQYILKQANRNELMSYFEFFNIWGASNTKNRSRIHQVNGEQYFLEALAEKKGVVLIIPHFGTWEIMNAWFAQHTTMTIMYKPVKNKIADQFVREARGRENATLVPTDESGVRQIFKALKQGGTTVILPDHTPNVGGTMIDYFGIPLASSNLSAKLIQKTKAKALFLYAIRNDHSGYDMTIKPISTDIYQGSDIEGTRIIYQMIEDLIEQYPEHYHWSYKRFKANPKLNKIYNIPTEQALEKVTKIRQR